jgi:hypothetical protein
MESAWINKNLVWEMGTLNKFLYYGTFSEPLAETFKP